MKTKKSIPVTVDEYINLQQDNIKTLLQQLREIILKNAPNVEEKISYGMPAYKLNGMLAYFAVHTNHIGFYAMPSAIIVFEKELKDYHTLKGTIQFPLNKSLPKKLLTDIIKFRVKENFEKAEARRLKVKGKK